MHISWQIASLILLGGSTILLFVGLPVAFSFIAINIVGAILFLGGDAGLNQMLRNSAAAVINFSLTPIPLFVLMGEVLFHTGLAIKVIEGIERLVRAGPSGCRCGGGRHGVFGHLGFDDRDDGDARVADAAGDDLARLQSGDGDRADHGDWCG